MRSLNRRSRMSEPRVTSVRFGKNRRLVLLLAWLTLLPDIGPLPVSSQTRDMGVSSFLCQRCICWRRRSRCGKGVGSGAPRPEILAGDTDRARGCQPEYPDFALFQGPAAGRI